MLVFDKGVLVLLKFNVMYVKQHGYLIFFLKKKSVSLKENILNVLCGPLWPHTFPLGGWF